MTFSQECMTVNRMGRRPSTSLAQMLPQMPSWTEGPSPFSAPPLESDDGYFNKANPAILQGGGRHEQTADEIQPRFSVAACNEPRSTMTLLPTRAACTAPPQGQVRPRCPHIARKLTHTADPVSDPRCRRQITKRRKSSYDNDSNSFTGPGGGAAWTLWSGHGGGREHQVSSWRV